MSFDYINIAMLSLKVAGVATLAITPIAIALGLLCARRRFPGKSLLETLLLMPMILPPVAVGLILLELLAPNRPLGRLYDAVYGKPIILDWPAAACAAAVVSLPLFFNSARLAFENVSRELEDAAKMFGKSPLRIFLLVTLPLAWRGIVYGLLLSFARALGEFGATSIVAGVIPGRTETLALGIYQSISMGRDDQAWVLSGISFALALLSVGCGQCLIRRQRY